MRLSYQIAIPGVMTILSLLAMSGLTFYSYTRYVDFVDQTSNQMERAGLYISELSELRNQQTQDLLSYAFRRDPSYLKNLNDLDQRMEAVVSDLKIVLPDSPESERVIRAFLSARIDTRMARIPLVEAVNRKRLHELDHRFQVWFDKDAISRAALRDVRNHAMTLQQGIGRLARRSMLRAAVIFGALLSFSLLSVLMTLTYFHVHVATPLTRLTRKLSQVGTGQYVKVKAIAGDDEVSELFRSFNGMVDRLDQTTAQLKESNQRLESFTSIAAHDLRSPLCTMKDFAGLLAETEKDHLSPEGQLLVARIDKVGDRALHLVDKLLSLSRASRQPIHPEVVNLNYVIEDVIHTLESQIQHNKGIVQVTPLPEVHGDPIQLGELFQNLISNALKYHQPNTPPRVTITSQLRTLQGKAFIRLSVRDNGIGFQPSEAHMLYTPFHRATNSPLYEGSGVGLAICKEIVERHQGQIVADSTPGVGSVFHVDLPAASVKNRPLPELPV